MQGYAIISTTTTTKKSVFFVFFQQKHSVMEIKNVIFYCMYPKNKLFFLIRQNYSLFKMNKNIPFTSKG